VTNLTSVDAFLRMSRRENYELFAYVPLEKKASLDIDDLLINAISTSDFEIMETKPKSDPLDKLPLEYHEFADVFSRKDSDSLPLHRPNSDH
jgi:hypothetical protein